MSALPSLQASTVPHPGDLSGLMASPVGKESPGWTLSFLVLVGHFLGGLFRFCFIAVEAGNTGPGPRTASSCIKIRQKAKPPLCFEFPEALTHGGIASKTEPLQHLNKKR